jgi:hypothetical protein
MRLDIESFEQPEGKEGRNKVTTNSFDQSSERLRRTSRLISERR